MLLKGAYCVGEHFVDPQSHVEVSWRKSIVNQIKFPKPISVHYILNKSENATPALFAIYIQNDASQKSKLKCI